MYQLTLLARNCNILIGSTNTGVGKHGYSAPGLVTVVLVESVVKSKREKNQHCSSKKGDDLRHSNTERWGGGE